MSPVSPVSTALACLGGASEQQRRGRPQARWDALTFARFLGHLKLDEKLLQLLSHCCSSDEALVV